MSTRGFFGVVVNSTPKIMYNHCGSHPQYLGINFLNDVKMLSQNMENFRRLANDARLVAESSIPTKEDKIKFAKYTNLEVSNQSKSDWYCLTRGLQGKLKECLELGIIVNCEDFPKDSLFCEWGYLVDLDSNVLEVYQGFQKQLHTEGRFASDTHNEGYYPGELNASFYLNDLPTNEYFLNGTIIY